MIVIFSRILAVSPVNATVDLLFSGFVFLFQLQETGCHEAQTLWGQSCEMYHKCRSVKTVIDDNSVQAFRQIFDGDILGDEGHFEIMISLDTLSAETCVILVTLPLLLFVLSFTMGKHLVFLERSSGQLNDNHFQ